MAKKGRDFMKKRLHQLWIPGFLTFIISTVFLMTLQKLGFQARIVGDGPNAILFCGPWLVWLLFVWALVANLSSRAGGTRRAGLIATNVPQLTVYPPFLL